MKKVAVVLLVFTAAVSAMWSFGSVASAQGDPPGNVATETVTIRYQPRDELTAVPVVDELEPETVVTIRAIGFDANTSGSIRQCVAGSQQRCRNRFWVRFDDSGHAIFQYLITNRFPASTDDAQMCRLGAERCTIELRSGAKTSVIDTVFIDAAPPPGRLVVTPSRNLVLGDTVSVVASEFQPGAELELMVCAAPSTSGSRCGPPGPVARLTITSEGTAETQLILDVAKVGSDGVACARRVTCHIVANSNQPGVRARPAVLVFSDHPGADFNVVRVIGGLSAAISLILLAVWLLRSTNWNPPSESDSSLIDEAEFADLDFEAAQFEEQSIGADRV